MTDGWQAAADPARRVGRRVEHHATIGSTNDRARAALAEDAGDGLVVVAEEQTEGRGRRGRRWESPPGTNLMVSVALRPRLGADRAAWLGIAAALAVRAACEALVRAGGFAVKWPNDVVDAAGRKVAGLLVETAVAGEDLAEAVIGIGINANWPRDRMPPEIAGRAVSLRDLADGEIDRVALLSSLLDLLAAEVEALERGASPVARLRAVSALTGREVQVQTDDDMLSGAVAGIGEDGSLLLDTSLGRVALSVGEVVGVRDRVAVA